MSRGLHLINEAADNVAAGIFDDRKSFFDGVIDVIKFIDIPSCAEAFGLFLARQFISEIPDELIEATRVYGAGELRIFFSVIVPNCHALIGVLVIFTFMWRWNDFLWPLIVVKDQAHYTVQLGLKVMQSYQYVDWSSVMSASLVCILPMVVVFACFQRFFVQGIAASGIKG